MRTFGILCLTVLLSSANAAETEQYADGAQILAMIPADTRIIPGHGPLAGLVELGEFHDMLKATISNIEARIAAGESLESIVSMGLGPERASYASGIINEERRIRTVQASAALEPGINSSRSR